MFFRDDCHANIPKTSTAESSTCKGPMVCVADGEQVASNHSSEVFNPALHMRKMIQLHAPGENLPETSNLTTPVTPDTFKVSVFHQTNHKLHIRSVAQILMQKKIMAKSSKLWSYINRSIKVSSDQKKFLYKPLQLNWPLTLKAWHETISLGKKRIYIILKYY